MEQLTKRDRVADPRNSITPRHASRPRRIRPFRSLDMIALNTHQSFRSSPDSTKLTTLSLIVLVKVDRPFSTTKGALADRTIAKPRLLREQTTMTQLNIDGLICCTHNQNHSIRYRLALILTYRVAKTIPQAVLVTRAPIANLAASSMVCYLLLITLERAAQSL